MRVRFTPAGASRSAVNPRLRQQGRSGRSVAPGGASHRALGDTPYEGRATDEPNARVIVVPQLRYFIFYTIAEDEVHITHIRHTSRRRPSGWMR